jgi:predicted flap endonuclease-1-like 5' DNA nuclease
MLRCLRRAVPRYSSILTTTSSSATSTASAGAAICRTKVVSSNISTINSPFVVRALSTSTSTNQQHQLNINKALKKKDEGHYFQDLVDSQQSLTTFQGIGPKHAEALAVLGLTTIAQLSDYKFFHLSRSLVTLATIEEVGGRLEESTMNVNFGLIKEFESCSFTEIITLPVHALQGITPEKGEVFASLGVKTIQDLAQFKFCKWAEAMKIVAKFEEQTSDSITE